VTRAKRTRSSPLPPHKDYKGAYGTARQLCLPRPAPPKCRPPDPAVRAPYGFGRFAR